MFQQTEMYTKIYGYTVIRIHTDWYKGTKMPMYKAPYQLCTQDFFFRGGSTNSVEDRENGDLEAAAPKSGVLEAAVIWYKKFYFIQ